jgi:signal transduction histidine kinase
VRVAVRPAGEHVAVTVTNTLTRTNGFDHDALSAGTGLLSLRERAALLGGELSAGRDGELWRVGATLPLHATDGRR